MNESKFFMCFSALFTNNSDGPVWEGYRKSVTVVMLYSKERFQIFFILNSLRHVFESETCDV